MRVIGTAGHVDHGKSTLVAALTGVHPDRLKEEQEREMTIDLGFAWMALPGGEPVGIVDVPGHRDFIENMLAGVGGIDATLFVIAADEGMMPQTREHLAILNILQIPTGVVALTKIDLAPDPEWLDLIEADVRQALRGGLLENAPLVRVSARTGAGLDDLKAALAACLQDQPHRPDLGRPRLPVDRAFTMPGFGTVVTGTLLDGSLALGDEVELLPEGYRGRVRGLQSHKQKRERAEPGSRTAVNVAGIELDQARRGQVLARPGVYRPTQRLDARFKLEADASAPLRHNQEVKVFIGAAEVMGRVRLLGVEQVRPDEEGWLQLELRDPVVAARGDRYILRRPSPGETLGGGAVVDPQPGGRSRRFSESVLARLEALDEGTPAEVMLHACLALGIVPLREAARRARLEPEAARAAIEALTQSGQLLVLDGEGDDALAAAAPTWEELSARILAELRGYHAQHSLRRGMPREELKSRLRASQRVFTAALRRLAAQGALEENQRMVWLAGWRIQLSPRQRAQADALLERFARTPFSPPGVKEAQTEVGEDVFFALVELGELTQVSPEVAYRAEDFAAQLAWAREVFTRQETLTVAEFRDQMQTSRKYALAFLEYLDATGVTERRGDARGLKRR